ncbi:MAG: hypothetical protein ACKVVP_07410 [Chloroflexota bacterium]
MNQSALSLEIARYAAIIQKLGAAAASTDYSPVSSAGLPVFNDLKVGLSSALQEPCPHLVTILGPGFTDALRIQ